MGMNCKHHVIYGCQVPEGFDTEILSVADEAREIDFLRSESKETFVGWQIDGRDKYDGDTDKITDIEAELTDEIKRKVMLWFERHSLPQPKLLFVTTWG